MCVCRGMGCGGWMWGGEQVFLQSECCMRGPEWAGVIPTTYQIHMGVEPLSEVMPAFYHKHTQTDTHTQNRLVCKRSGLSSLLCDPRACQHPSVNPHAASHTEYQHRDLEVCEHLLMTGAESNNSCALIRKRSHGGGGMSCVLS